MLFFLLQIFVGSADEPEVGLLPSVASQPLISVLLHDPQQFCLKPYGEFPDFIEKKGTSVRNRKRSVTSRHGSGKCPTLVSEELTARQLRHDRRAVEDH